jgi:hypothetical protein
MKARGGKTDVGAGLNNDEELLKRFLNDEL